MLLVGLVVLLGLGLRASLIVMLAIPLSIFIAIGWVDLSGFGLQQISIVGLVIALGLLVDNAIVVTENVRRFREQGLSGFQAAVRGTSQVGWALVSSTATTVLAHVPMVLLQTETGTFIRSMPVTVIYALTASLLISLALTPYLASRFLKKPPHRPSASEEHAQQGGMLQPLFNRVVEGPYRRALRFALARPAVVIVSALLLFAGSLALFPLVGVSLFPKAEKPLLLIDIDLPEGSSLDKTDIVARYVESILDGRDEIAHYASNVGHGNPRIYYNAIPKSEIPTHAQMLVALKTYCPKTMTALVQDLRAVFDGYPGADIKVRELHQGPGVEAPIAIKILGDDLGVLRELAGRVATLLAQTPGTLHVENPTRKRKTDLRLNINRDKVGLLGLPMADIDRTVLASMAGMRVAGFRNQEGNEYDVVVRLPIDGRPSVADLDRISVASVTGTQVPLRQVASVELASVPKRIEHYNFERSVTVTADVQDGYNVAAVTRQITEGLDTDLWPTGYRYVVGGEQESREESFGGLEKALLVALFGIFGVLVLQFRSFLQPLIVFTAIPFAITGAILALLVTGHTFSFVAFVGLTSLVGIVVNNSIILVDYANQLRREGRSLVEAVREAGETRFTPILLTTLTTIGALLPLTLQGSALWSPFGWAIIGGLLVSTFLTLILVPTLYKLLTRPGVPDTTLDPNPVP